MDAPRYVVIVMLDSPKRVPTGQTTAAYTAAPVVSRFILRAGPMLGVMPDADARHRRQRIAAADLARAGRKAAIDGGSRMKLGGLVAGGGDASVTGFAIDHRKVAPGTIFGAFEGAKVNGEDFISRRRSRRARSRSSRGRG